MARITRVSLIALPTLLAGLLAFAGCSSDNDPSVSDSSDSGADSTSEATSSKGSGGTSSSTTSSATSGGGSSSDTNATDTSSTDGSTTGTLGDPPCDLSTTVAGDEIKKGVACTDDDPALCWRTCGPTSVGWKSEECQAGVYAEGDCLFPDDGTTYECFKIADPVSADCPTDETPQATMDCDVPTCTPCNLDNQYLDSSGNAKVGYCVCQEPNSEGTRTWTCASATAWPCPAGAGC